MADKPFKSDNPPNFLRSSGKDAADTTGGKATPFAKGSPGGTLPPGTSYTKPSSSDPANNAKAPPVPTLRKMNPTLPYTTPAASSLGGGRGGFHPIAAIQHLFGRGNKPKAAAASASANPALPPASKTVDTSSQPPGPGEGYTPKRAAVEAGAPPPSRQAGDLFNQIRARQANTPLTTPRQPVRQSLMTTPVTNQPGKTERVSYTPNTPKLRGGASLAASPRRPQPARRQAAAPTTPAANTATARPAATAAPPPAAVTTPAGSSDFTKRFQGTAKGPENMRQGSMKGPYAGFNQPAPGKPASEKVLGSRPTGGSNTPFTDSLKDVRAQPSKPKGLPGGWRDVQHGGGTGVY